MLNGFYKERRDISMGMIMYPEDEAYQSGNHELLVDLLGKVQGAL